MGSKVNLYSNVETIYIIQADRLYTGLRLASLPAQTITLYSYLSA